MELGEITQTPVSTFETAQKIAQERGRERREEVGRRIGGILEGIKEKISRGVDFALGSPEAAAYLGTEAIMVGKEKAVEVRDSVVEAGTRAWEGVVDIKDRLVQRGRAAKDRLVTRYEQGKETTKNKVAELEKRAAVWGLTNIAAPIEGRLQQVYEIPANIREWQAVREGEKARKQERRAQLAREKNEERIKALQEKMARIQGETGRQVEDLGKLRNTAFNRASELTSKAEERRKQATQTFGKAQRAIRTLQAR
jgi:hypothetical protein